MKGTLIIFLLCALTSAQRVEVPVQPYASPRSAIELAKIRGYLADPSWARIARAKVTLQRQESAGFGDVAPVEFRNIATVETDKVGNFDFGERLPGIYRLVASAPGFCKGVILIKRVLAKGWSGLRIALPLGMNDGSSGHCDQKLMVEPMEK